MAGLSLHQPCAFTFGILGNVFSFLVYLAPGPTFFRIYRKKSTEGYQPEPYVFALFSAMLWIYYAVIKTHANLIITINSFGCVVETIYIVIYLAYALRKARIYTAKMILLLNVGLFCLIVFSTLLLSDGYNRLKYLGWISMIVSVSVFAAPLSIIRLVIRLKSVEFMPICPSFFLTLSAVAWFSYGLFTKDIYVMLPNVLGFGFGVVQMVLYIMYKDASKKVMMEEAQRLPEYMVAGMINLNKVRAEPEQATIHDQEKHDKVEEVAESIIGENNMSLP